MSTYVTRDEFERRMRVLTGEVEGEKAVTRHILEQAHRNGDDLGIVKSDLATVKSDLAIVKSRLDHLAGDMVVMRADLGHNTCMLDVLRQDILMLRNAIEKRDTL